MAAAAAGALGRPLGAGTGRRVGRMPCATRGRTSASLLLRAGGWAATVI